MQPRALSEVAMAAFAAAAAAALVLGQGLALSLFVSGCGCGKTDTKPAAADAGRAPAGLTPELSAKVLAKVGERTITLGEYAQALERMDRFERLRYQTPERRRTLLDEIINVELLAQEARRRGLDKRPETQERLRQVLRDELLRSLQDRVPAPGDIPEADVRKYFDEHKDEFRDPERRRVAQIVVADAGRAKLVLERAAKASPAEWGALVREFSLDKPPAPSPTAPAELAGDVGIVSGPGDARGANPKVPDPVREAVFKIDRLGGVFEEPVQVGARYHVVRLAGKSEARQRTFTEAERSVRVTLAQHKLREAEQALEAELRKRFPVTLDEAALSRVKVPSGQTHGQ